MVLRFVEWRRFCSRYSLPIAQGAKNPQLLRTLRHACLISRSNCIPAIPFCEVAERYDVKRDDLLALNEIPDHDRTIEGQRFCVDRPMAAVAKNARRGPLRYRAPTFRPSHGRA
jgi:hypothetical protein